MNTNEVERRKQVRDLQIIVLTCVAKFLLLCSAHSLPNVHDVWDYHAKFISNKLMDLKIYILIVSV